MVSTNILLFSFHKALFCEEQKFCSSQLSDGRLSWFFPKTLATLRQFLSTPPSGSPPHQEGLSSDRTVPSTHLHIPSARGLIRRSQTEVWIVPSNEVNLLFTVHNHLICSCWDWRESPQPCSGLKYFQRVYLILLPLWVLGPSVCFVWQPVKVLRATLIKQEVFNHITRYFLLVHVTFYLYTLLSTCAYRDTMSVVRAQHHSGIFRHSSDSYSYFKAIQINMKTWLKFISLPKADAKIKV